MGRLVVVARGLYLARHLFTLYTFWPSLFVFYAPTQYSGKVFRRLAYDLHAMNQFIIIIRSIIIWTIYQIYSRLPALSGGGLYHLWEHWSGCRKWAFVDNSINWKRTHFHLAKKRISFIDQYVPEKEKGVFKILKLKSILTGELKHQIAAKKVSDSEGVVLIMMSICLSLCNVLVFSFFGLVFMFFPYNDQSLSSGGVLGPAPRSRTTGTGKAHRRNSFQVPLIHQFFVSLITY